MCKRREQPMKFTKMHGIGNDYVYVNCFEESVKNPAEVSKFVSDRHFGIGSDGLILISPSAIADFRMNIYNADGSQAEMCGNGIRCLAKYVYDYGLTDKTEISVETLAGIKYLKLQVENGKVAEYRPDRVMQNSKNETIVVDFKFGKQKVEHHEQVRKYIGLLKSMGHHRVKGYLWYVYPNRIVEVIK